MQMLPVCLSQQIYNLLQYIIYLLQLIGNLFEQIKWKEDLLYNFQQMTYVLHLMLQHMSKSVW